MCSKSIEGMWNEKEIIIMSMKEDWHMRKPTNTKLVKMLAGSRQAVVEYKYYEKKHRIKYY